VDCPRITVASRSAVDMMNAVSVDLAMAAACRSRRTSCVVARRLMRSVRDASPDALPGELLSMTVAPPERPTRASGGEGRPNTITVSAGSDIGQPENRDYWQREFREYN